MPTPVDATSEEGLRIIFAALVETQDKGVSVADSRKNVARQLGVRVEDVRRAEKEELEHEWPPLEAAA